MCWHCHLQNSCSEKDSRSGLTDLYETLECSERGMARCAHIIKTGGVVVFPTDTVYGIGCDPYNDDAVRRVFSIKGRDEKKSLPVLVGSLDDVERIVMLGQKGRALAKKFWPGAVTIIAPLRDSKISAAVTAGKNSLAVRIPANRCVQGVLKSCKYMVGTSANLSGERPFSDVQSVLRSLSGFDAILVENRSLGGKASTVIDLSVSKPKIIREGAVSAGELRKVLEEL